MKEIFDTNAESIYIHIPFCQRKCNYCAFVSFTNISQYENEYIDALCKEINCFSSAYPIKTIYLGGGTPNLLSLKSIEKLFSTLHKNFNISENAEISMEFNPYFANLNYINEISNFGLNRISLGVQSFNDRILKILNRLHDSKTALYTIDEIKKSNINNFSIDLIYGIFNQTINDVEKDLKIIKSINPNHISTYGLKIEKNTPFYKYDKSNLPGEDECAEMYTLISNTLCLKGYEHYEISNFALPGFEAMHNLTYWQNKEYFGFGVASHGYLNNIRYNNTENINKYIDNPVKYKTLKPCSITDNFEETVFLGLRLNKGINLKYIKEKFGIDILKTKANIIKQTIDNDYATFSDDTLCLTLKGFLISDYIIGEILS